MFPSMKIQYKSLDKAKKKEVEQKKKKNAVR